MTTLEITDTAITEKARLIVQMLRDRFPDGDWTRNSALYQHVLGAISLNALVIDAPFAELRQLFDLDAILAIEDPATQRQALERFARNKLLTVAAGSPSRGFVDVVFSTQQDGVVPPGTRFYGTNFVLQVTNTEPQLFGIDELAPVVSASNQIIGYRLRLPAVSLTTGVAANINPQRLVAFDRFAQAISYVDVPTPFTGGREAETAAEFAERLPDAVTLRQPTTYRALRTVLREAFQSIQSQPRVIGYGEPEMVRDLAPAALGVGDVHRGGAVDVYVDPPHTLVPVSGIVGSEQLDVSPLILHFRDIDLDARDVDLRGLVGVGDTLRLYNPESSEATSYRVNSVHAYYLTVSELLPFRDLRPTQLHEGLTYETVTLTPSISTIGLPTEETRFTTQNVGDYAYLTDGTNSLWARILAVSDLNQRAFGQTVRIDDPTNQLNLFTAAQTRLRVYRRFVRYSVGTNFPTFDNKIPARDYGQITRSIRVPGCVLLDTPSVARVYGVEIDDPGNLPESTGTGRILFPQRVSTAPTPVSTPVTERMYQVLNHAPAYAGSTRASTCLRVGPQETRSGTDGAIFAAPGTLTFSTSGPSFSIDDVGSRIVVLNAVNAQNAGAYVITSLVDPSTVNVEQLRRLAGITPAVSETSLPWTIDSAHRYDGRRLRATLTGIPEIASMQSYLDDDAVRPTASDLLVRGYHAVYVGVGIANASFPGTGTTTPLRYQLKRSLRTSFSEADAALFLANTIRTFDRTSQELNAFDLAAALAAQYSTWIDNVLPIELTYILIDPYGGLIYFRSNDRLSLEAPYLVQAQDTDRLTRAKRLGVGERTIQLMCDADLIRFQAV